MSQNNSRENALDDFEKWRKSNIQETEKGFKLDRLLVHDEAAKLLKISTSLLKKNRLEKKIPYVSFPGGRKVRYEISDIYLKNVNTILNECANFKKEFHHRDKLFRDINALYYSRKQFQIEITSFELSIGQVARILRVHESYIHKIKNVRYGDRNPQHFDINYRHGSYFFPINSVLKFIHRHRVPSFVS